MKRLIPILFNCNSRYDADCEGYINYPLFREAIVRGHTPNRRFAKTGLSTSFCDDGEGKGDEDEESEMEEVMLAPLIPLMNTHLVIVDSHMCFD